MKQIVTALILTLGVALTSSAAGLKVEDLVSSPNLNPDIPTPETVLRVGIGERHLYHHDIIHYLDTLAESSPRMVALGAHATSYGGRELVSYAISSPDNLAKLDEIKAARSRIIDSSADIDLARQPVVVHMMYSIHGNEPSGANSTPLVAYYLTASQDPQLLQQLDRVVIIFNPMQNPDGLDRFANWTNNHRGQNPSDDPNDREHREHTPNGRTNYYGFDLNRDWLAHQHPESRGRLALFHEWKPNVQLDFHEQGSNSHFFFMPGKPERTNPLTPAINQVLTAKIGEYHAEALDQDGILYFTQENYDDFFMGKGSTYPDLYGTVGILFEQPSSRGIKQDTRNGLLQFPATIANQFRTSLSSIKAASELKDELLTYQRGHYLKRAKNTQTGYFLAAAEGDPARLLEFVRVLEGHQIRVEMLGADVSAEGKEFKAGQTLAIPLDQTSSQYLLALWNRQLEFEENVFYDVSTWTLPLAFNLKHTENPISRVKTQDLDINRLASTSTLPTSDIGYLIDWRSTDSAELLYDLLEAGANVRVARSPFTAQTITAGSMEFGFGTLFVSAEHEQTVPEAAFALLEGAAQSGIGVYAASSAYTPKGIDLGSRDFEVLKLPKVALITGPGTSPYETGEVWHLLDRKVNMPITMLDSFRLSSTDLSKYTHIILTDPLRAVTGISKKLDAFVQAGGVLWAQGDGTIEWLNKEGVTSVVWRETQDEMDAAKRAKLRKKDDAKPDDVEALLPARKPFIEADDNAAFKLVRGVILDGDIDITHPLGYGYTRPDLPMFRTNNHFMARAENAYSTPILYSSTPLLSGYMSEENQKLAANSAGLIVDAKGRGAIVLSLDNPAFRAFWWGSQRVLVNAIFFGTLLEEPR